MLSLLTSGLPAQEQSLSLPGSESRGAVVCTGAKEVRRRDRPYAVTEEYKGYSDLLGEDGPQD